MRTNLVMATWGTKHVVVDIAALLRYLITLLVVFKTAVSHLFLHQKQKFGGSCMKKTFIIYTLHQSLLSSTPHEDEIGRILHPCWDNKCTLFSSGNLKGKANLEELSVDGRMNFIGSYERRVTECGLNSFSTGYGPVLNPSQYGNIRLVSLQDGEYPEYCFVITSARKTLPHASSQVSQSVSCSVSDWRVMKRNVSLKRKLESSKRRNHLRHSPNKHLYNSFRG
jgi:hypothetical protein